MPEVHEPCPRCDAPLLRKRLSPDEIQLACPICGWPGRDVRVGPDPAEPAVPLPPELWELANGHHERYVELMIEHGHVVPSPGAE